MGGEIRRFSLTKANSSTGKEVNNMPTSKELAKAESARRFMIRKIMEEKEALARLRLAAIEAEQPGLTIVYRQYLEAYKKHIHPLMRQVDRYFSNIHEKRKHEHFLQGQADHLAAVEEAAKRPVESRTRNGVLADFLNIQKLPYADKHEVGKKRVEKKISHDSAKEMMDKLKALPPEEFARLLKEVGVK
jgi:hypothetical protein